MTKLLLVILMKIWYERLRIRNYPLLKSGYRETRNLTVNIRGRGDVERV